MSEITTILYDGSGVVLSLTLDGVVYTPEALSALRFAQVEADALREGRAGLLRKIRELEGLLAESRADREVSSALLTAARRAQRAEAADATLDKQTGEKR